MTETQLPESPEVRNLIKSLKDITERNLVLERRVDQLMTLVDVSSAIYNELDYNRLVEGIMFHVTKALEADRSSLFIVDQERKVLKSHVSQGTKEFEIPFGIGLAGWVAQEQKCLNIADAYLDDRFNPAIDKKTGYRTRSVLAVPVRDREGNTIGIIQVINRLSGDGIFDAAQESLLQALSMPIALSVDNARLYTELRQLMTSVIWAMADTIDARHKGTAGHTKRMTDYCLGMARTMKVSQTDMEIVEFSAILHDFGKIGVPEAILVKPGKLTDDELFQIRLHATYTHDILNKIHFPLRFAGLPLIASSHHEKHDGTGYPRKMKGTEIPMISRILAICDVFDAITAPREYRAPIDPDNACSMIAAQSGSHFDPEVVEAFFEWIRKENVSEKLRMDFRHLYDQRKPDQVD